MRLAPSWLAALLLGLAACGEGPIKPDLPSLPPPRLLVVNKCPTGTPPFQALHLHTAADNYRDAQNHLAQPLQVEERTQVTTSRAGQWYVTVIREKLDQSAVIAMTTRTPLELLSGVYELWVFSTSFRLWASRDAGVPPAEAGPHDLAIERPRDAAIPDQPRSDQRLDAPREAGADAAREGGTDALHD
jgi:hypothetical protein